MTTLTETLKAGACLVSEAAGTRSRDHAVLTGGPYKAGTVLGTKYGTQTVAAAVAFAGNTGTGTVGSLTGDANAMPGDWKLICIEPATNAGVFEVFRPDGTLDGRATVAVAYNGGINFTISDATDFVAGDGFTINVSYAAGKKTIHDPAATDGSEVADSILFDDADGSAADVPVTVIARDAEVNASELIWKSGMTGNQKTAALAALAAKGILAR